MPDSSLSAFSSNVVRLAPRHWLVALGLIVALCWAIPIAWQRAEPLQAGPDYRLPYSLGEDYWLYQRRCGQAASQDATLVIGDSVVWGHYVGKEETLSHYLSELGGGRFLNLGVDGIHPVAMAGLVEHYGRALRGKKVLLHCNLLWMSSKTHDLQLDKHFAFNHPRLVPQFSPPIPCYKEPVARRLSMVVERNVPFFGWVNHVRAAYFGNTDFWAWTMEHPYDNPLRAVTFELPSADEGPTPPPTPETWTQRGIRSFSPAWVDLDQSLQWASFRRTVQTLRGRGNRLFVLVGPFNEHLLKHPSRQAYRDRVAGVASWLAQHGIAHFAPPPLASHLYADASHPLRYGYAALAKQLLASAPFREFLEGVE